MIAALGAGRAWVRANRWAQAPLIALAAVAVFLLWLGWHDRRVTAAHDLSRELARERRAAAAREAAASARVADAMTNKANEEDLHHAIAVAPSGGSLSPAAHALACERLRKRGRDPAACRPCGGDRGQARAGR